MHTQPRNVRARSGGGPIELLEHRRLLSAVLVKDINEAGVGAISTDPSVVANGLLFYDAPGGTWVSDGTAAGTRLLTPNVFARDRIAHTDGFVYFSAENTGDRELWKSDGGPAGMVLVKEINPATGFQGGSEPFGFTSLGQHLLFFANDGLHGLELWRTDGTDAGTVMVKDIRLGVQNGVLQRTLPLDAPITATLGGAVYFFADADADGADLWKTDGTRDGTVVVKKGIRAWPPSIHVVGGAMFFESFTGTGFELWRSDGTEAGTVPYAQSPGAMGSAMVVDDLLYFSNQQDYELWRTDGTADGTFRVKDLNPGETAYAYIGVRGALGNELIFVADDQQGPGLWKSDGTEAGTVLLKRLTKDPSFYRPRPAQRIGDRLYVSMSGDDGSGRELWVTDGTPEGTRPVADVNPGPLSSAPHLLGELGGNLLFAASDLAHGQELWISDGTAAGTRLVLDATAGTVDSSPSHFAYFNGKAFFRATEGRTGAELWQTDGTPGGTVLFKDIHPTGSSAPFSMVRLGQTLFFGASDGVHGFELWKTDGTDAGTTLVHDVRPGSADSLDWFDTDIVAAPGGAGTHVFFVADDGVHGQELWASDGTTAGTRLMADLAPGAAHGMSNGLRLPRTNVADRWALTASGVLIFEAQGDVWRSDGTPEGTYLLRDLRTTAPQDALAPRHFKAVGDTVYFAGPSNDEGKGDGAQGQLWKTDGTVAGTVMVKQVVPVTAELPNGRILAPASLGGALYFIAWQQQTPGGALDAWLWKSDGAEAGTTPVLQIPFTRAMTAVGDLLHFFHDPSSGPTQLWRSDGSAQGTRKIGENFAWDLGPRTYDVNRRLVFTASDSSAWVSDGETAVPLTLPRLPGGGEVNGLMLPDAGAFVFRARHATLGEEPYVAAAPRADGGGPYTLTSGGADTTVLLDGSASGDLDPSEVLTYAWDLDGDSLFGEVGIGAQRGDEAGVSVRFDAAGLAPGAYPVHLRVSNSFAPLGLVGEDAADVVIAAPATPAFPPLVTPVGELAVGEPLFTARAGTVAEFNGHVYFSTMIDPATAALWKSDPATNGVTLVQSFPVRALTREPLSPRITDLKAVGDTLYFMLDTGDNFGIQLWKTDGTTQGTDILKYFSIVYAPFSPGVPMADVNGRLFFDLGRLWTSDGTNAGTMALTSSRPLDLTLYNGKLYFIADGGLHTSDGTAAGTVLVKPLAAQPFGDMIVVANGLMFIAATDGLYRSDGTAAGTTNLTVRDGVTNVSVNTLVGTPDALFFKGSAHQLWRTDGTEAGTIKLAQFPPGRLGNIASAGDGIIFIATPNTTADLWRSDGTVAGTQFVRTVPHTNLGVTPGTPQGVAVNGVAYFPVRTPENGEELWRSDGTDQGTRLDRDVFPGPAGSLPRAFVPAAGKLYFNAIDPAAGYALFVTDGTAAGTHRLADYIPGPLSPVVERAALPDGRYFFAGGALTQDGSELYVTDGTPQGTTLVEHDVADPLQRPRNPVNLTVVGDTLYFAATTQKEGTELWKSDGTPGGTVLVRDLAPGTASSIVPPRFFTALGDAVLFSTGSGGSGYLWRTDGTSAGTVMLKEFNAFPESSEVSPTRVLGGVAYFTVNEELWRTDGTPEGTLLIRSFASNLQTPIRHLTVSDGALYFAAADGGSSRYVLWRSDGTADGTVKLFDSPNSSSPTIPSTASFGSVNGLLLFTACVSTSCQPWRSDGTPAGTSRLVDTPAITFNDPAAYTPLPGGQRSVFVATHADHGRELWITDGTADGTRLLHDLNPGPASSAPSDLHVLGRRVFFSADDGAGGGRELWFTDGARAYRVRDLNAGGASSSPTNLASADGTLFFTANDGTTARVFRFTPPTINGDINGDGRINADDYFGIDRGFLAQPANPTYVEGDFNYDGRVNADDYFLIDQAFLAQGGRVAAMRSAVTSVALESNGSSAGTATDESVLGGARGEKRVAVAELEGRRRRRVRGSGRLS